MTNNPVGQVVDALPAAIENWMVVSDSERMTNRMRPSAWLCLKGR
ncbi:MULTISPECIES: hypothetical protein [unclassified Halomonas]